MAEEAPGAARSRFQGKKGATERRWREELVPCSWRSVTHLKELKKLARVDACSCDFCKPLNS